MVPNVASLIKYPNVAGKSLAKGDITQDKDLAYIGDFDIYHSWRKVFQTGTILTEFQAGLYYRPFHSYTVNSVGHYVGPSVVNKVNVRIVPKEINSQPLGLAGRFLRKNEIVEKDDLVSFSKDFPRKWRKVMASGHACQFDNFIFHPEEPYRCDSNYYFVGRLDIKTLEAPKQIKDKPISRFRHLVIKDDFS